jgi:hypothetical protein
VHVGAKERGMFNERVSLMTPGGEEGDKSC